MNNQTPQCPDCQAPMRYVQGMRDVVCDNCHSSWHIPGNDDLQTINSQFGPLYYTWIPDGWSCNAVPDNTWASNQEPTTYDLQLSSPDGTNIYFFPRAYFRASKSATYGINPKTLDNSHIYLPMDQYIPLRLQETFGQIQNLQMARMDDSILNEMSRQFQMNAAQHISNPITEQGIFEFAFLSQGMPCHGFIASILASEPDKAQAAVEQPSAAPIQPGETQEKFDLSFCLRGGILGAKRRGEKIPSIKTSPIFDKNSSIFEAGKKLTSAFRDPLWGRCMDVILLTPSDQFDLYYPIFCDFMLNVQYGPGYTASQQAEMQNVQQIQFNGAMQRQQMQMQASQNISRSIAQRNDIIMSGWENRSAAQSRMMNNYSEAIRGVNSYTNTYGEKVEASVRYDHVYQNGNQYVASDVNLEPGPGWTELKKNK